jgi:hypothetical protein
MDIKALTVFFKWSTIINVGLFFLSAIMILTAADFIYGVHGELFNIPREAFDIILYGFLGLYKIFILVFSLVPFIALLMVNKELPSQA